MNGYSKTNQSAYEYEKSIKRLIDNDELTQEQFTDYTNDYCWYCGRSFNSIDGERHIHKHIMIKRERTTKGLRNITTTYTRSIPIPECSECNEFHQIGDSAKKFASVAAHIIGFAIVGIPLLYATIIWWGHEGLGTIVIAGVLIAISIHFILYPLSRLLVLPYQLLYCRIRRGNYHKNLRNEKKVPLVKSAKKEGFRRPLL